MNIKEIKEIVEMIDNSSLTKFEYENSGVKLILKKENNTIISEPIKTYIEQKSDNDSLIKSEASQKIDNITSEVNDPNLVEITSPIVGTYYASPSPESEPFVKVGSKVEKGSKLCIIEAMKVMNEITSEFDCIIEKILVGNDEMVEYGKTLFLVKPL